MQTAEVVLAVLEAGWETTLIPGHFRTHVISRLRMAGVSGAGRAVGEVARLCRK
jgi:hypothetical protein